MSSQIISFELEVCFSTSTPVENKKDTVLFRYFMASLSVQALGRWIEFPYRTMSD